MMTSRPKLRLACVTLIALVSLASFATAVALGDFLLKESSAGITATHCEYKASSVLSFAFPISDSFEPSLEQPD